MKKNKKGFTLVELLAVVIVLIIVIFIAITKVRESNLKAQMNAIQANAGSYIKAVNDLAGVDSLTSDRMYSGTFGKYLLSAYGLKMSGTEPDIAEVYINDFEVETACVSYGKYKVLYEDGKLQKPVVGKCISGDRYMFAYTGKEQVFTAPYDGIYKLEAWGAQGGNSHDLNVFGGYGGYSVGEVYLKKGTKLYINVGENGKQVTSNTIVNSYNGGGSCLTDNASRSCGSGGGATHISYKSGTINNLSNSIEDILIVAGGGGGASTHNSDTSTSGGSGGGYIGVSGSSNRWGFGTGGTQTTGGIKATTSSDGQNGSFGLGGNGALNAGAGGGGGFYGGGGGHGGSAGGGSGYIGNESLINKAMYCYNCSESSDSSDKTFKTTCVESDAKSKCAKKGNGAVIITIAKPGTCDNCNPDIYNFGFTDGEETLVIPVTGTYKLEVWGAQGGSIDATYFGGYGGYSVGIVNLNKGDMLYINVGAVGQSNCNASSCAGGYNGGGSSGWYSGRAVYSSGGGGATSIATQSGLLSTFSSSQDKVLIVAGGGGGGTYYSGGSYSHSGGSGGGIEGYGLCGVNDKADSWSSSGCGGSQTQTGGVSLSDYGTTGGFGFGAGNTCSGEGSGESRKCFAPGAGGGWYGGSTGTHGIAGGGSGYIGNPLLTDKSMYCYNCTQSTEESTKTVSGTCSSLLAQENCAKIGNGYARISFVSNN